MQKTLIIQVEVGNTPGYVYRPQESPKAAEAAKLFDKHLIPTVERYCHKHGYDYQKITEYPKALDITYFNYSSKGEDYDFSKGGKNKCSTLIRYLHMGNPQYDRMIILDNDIWIPEWAESLPEINGHAGVQDLGKTWEGFRSQNKLPFDKFINGGVQMVDRSSGESLCKYVTNAVQNKIPPISGAHTDQGYMNHWRSQNIPSSYTLPFKWNYMVGCHKRTKDYSKQNFIHYAGWDGRGILMEDFKDGVIK